MESLSLLGGELAHDLNNLLAVALLHAEIALEELAEGDPRRSELEAIREAAEQATELSRRLTALGR